MCFTGTTITPLTGSKLVLLLQVPVVHSIRLAEFMLTNSKTGYTSTSIPKHRHTPSPSKLIPMGSSRMKILVREADERNRG